MAVTEPQVQFLREWVEHCFSSASLHILNLALAAEVTTAIPYRGETSCSTYFLTAGAFNKMRLLQSDRMAELFCRTLLNYRDAGKLRLHAFVVMPDHVHLLLTVPQGFTLERIMQLIKGGFSFQAGKLFEIHGPIRQKKPGSQSAKCHRMHRI